MHNDKIKKIYICGDSFGSTDPEHGSFSWVEQLANSLPKVEVINLSRVCASNLQISLQIDKSINDTADFIIYLATSSTRHDVELHPQKYYKELLDRFVDLANPDPHCDLTSYSSHSLDSTTRFETNQLKLLEKYHSEFGCIELDIYASELIIHATLARLVESRVPFLFDQGGFEHPSFGAGDKEYFKNYQKYRSAINIWDYVINQPLVHRPYHHIQDPSIHQKIAEYYRTKIIQYL